MHKESIDITLTEVGGGESVVASGVLSQRAIFNSLMLNPTLPQNLIMGEAVSHPTQNNPGYLRIFLLMG